MKMLFFCYNRSRKLDRCPLDKCLEALIVILSSPCSEMLSRLWEFLCGRRGGRIFDFFFCSQRFFNESFFFHFLGKYCGKICSARSFLPPSCAHQFSSSVCSQKCTVKSHLNRKILGCNVCVVSSCEILCIDKQSLAEYVIDARKQKTEYFAPSSWQSPLQKVWVQSELLSVVTNIFSLSLKKWELSLYLFPYLKSYYFSKEKQSVQCSQFLYSLLFYAITLSISP